MRNAISTIVAKKWKVLRSISTIFLRSKIGKNRLFQRGTCSRYEMKSAFQVSDAGFKKVNNGIILRDTKRFTLCTKLAPVPEIVTSAGKPCQFFPPEIKKDTYSS